MEVKEEEEIKLSSFAEYDTRKLVAIFNNFNIESECKVNLQLTKTFSLSYISMMRWSEMKIMDTPLIQYDNILWNKPN